jgi:hypothetical protein
VLDKGHGGVGGDGLCTINECGMELFSRWNATPEKDSNDATECARWVAAVREKRSD